MTAAGQRRGAATIGALLLLVFALFAGGCGKKATPEQIAAAKQERSRRLIEAGNEAYRIGDYRLAARRYAAAAVVSKDDPAAYFGMGMALSKLGRDEEARDAYARSRDLARRQGVLEWQGTRGAAPDTAEH